MILATRFTYIVEKSWKNMYFYSKWLHHLLFMTSYLVTIATDHHWTCLKMCARDEQTATEKSEVLIFYPLGKISEKPYTLYLVQLYVRGLIVFRNQENQVKHKKKNAK